jgi:hypothetical protein
VDEKAHHDFFQRCLQLYLEQDRSAVLEQMRRIMNNFAMPAIYDLADSRQRVSAIKELEIFSEDIYYREVYLPILARMGIDRREMRNRFTVPKSA